MFKPALTPQGHKASSASYELVSALRFQDSSSEAPSESPGRWILQEDLTLPLTVLLSGGMCDPQALSLLQRQEALSYFHLSLCIFFVWVIKDQGGSAPSSAPPVPLAFSVRCQRKIILLQWWAHN